MLARRPVVWAATSLLLAASLLTFAFLGCSKDKTTNPAPGGGGKELDSPSLAAGSGQFVHTFATAGTFPYHCSIHPVMTASITVATSGADSLSVDIQNQTSTGFQPATGTIKPGGYVHWRNTSGQSHTVTSN